MGIKYNDNNEYVCLSVHLSATRWYFVETGLDWTCHAHHFIFSFAF